MERINTLAQRAAHNTGRFSDHSGESLLEMRTRAHNETRGNLDQVDGYDCPLCLNRGYSVELQEERGNTYEVMVHCKCKKIREQLRKLKKSGLQNLDAYTFDNFQTIEAWQRAVKQIAQSYTSEGTPQKWLFVGGQNGAGKSHICTATAAEFVKTQGLSVYYMMWREETAHLKAIINENPSEYQRKTDELKRVELLYIDDLFKTGHGNRPTQGDINLAFEVLNHRYNAKLPTIISSELLLADIIDTDEAIGSRIAEMTVGRYSININRDRNKNWRLKGGVQF